MKAISLSASKDSPTKTPVEERIDADFQRYVCRRVASEGRHPPTHPSLRAVWWSWFAQECRQFFQESKIPEIFNNIDINELSPNLPAGYRALARMMLALRDEPKLLAIGGPRGTGKTALASGLIRKFCESGRPALYSTAHEYFDGLTSEEWEAKERFRKRHYAPDLLVLDEVQVRDSNREWQNNELTTLIDNRHRSGLTTVLISNLTPEALRANLGDSIWRRLIETGGQPIAADWPILSELAKQLWDEKKVGSNASR